MCRHPYTCDLDSAVYSSVRSTITPHGRIPASMPTFQIVRCKNKYVNRISNMYYIPAVLKFNRMFLSFSVLHTRVDGVSSTNALYQTQTSIYNKGLLEKINKKAHPMLLSTTGRSGRGFLVGGDSQVSS